MIPLGSKDTRLKAFMAKNASILSFREMVIDVSKGDPKVPTNEVCSDHDMICIIHGSWNCIVSQKWFQGWPLVAL